MPRTGTAIFAMRADQKFLMIKRAKGCGLDTWSLPGGKPEPGEHLMDAVRRELKEETGLEAYVTRLIATTEDVCTCGETWRTYWYGGWVTGSEEPVPAPDECSAVCWAVLWNLPRPLWQPYWANLGKRLLG